MPKHARDVESEDESDLEEELEEEEADEGEPELEEEEEDQEEGGARGGRWAGPTTAVVGTYERTLCGYEVEGDCSLTPIFNHPAHLGPIKAVASSGRWMVSGGGDEEIRIFNIRKRVEVGSLMRHNGPISCLRFYSNTHLVSGGDDKQLCVWRTKDWTCLASLEGHKGGINDLDIHPTGRIMISCARDKMVKLWDLVKADCVFSFVNPLPAASEQIRWSTTGQHFSLASQLNLAIFSAEASKLTQTLIHEKPVLCSAFISEQQVVTGSEDGIVRLWDVRSGKVAKTLEPHAQRIRAVVVDAHGRLLAASTDGQVSVYSKGDYEHATAKEHLRARVTCACMSTDGEVNKEKPKAPKKKKDKKHTRKKGFVPTSPSKRPSQNQTASPAMGKSSGGKPFGRKSKGKKGGKGKGRPTP